MEKETRSAIERATQRARQILEADFTEQLQGDYDVMLDGRVGETAGEHLIGHQKALRARIVAAVQHKRMAGMGPAEAVVDYLRDAAFTTLNRFVALKMLEARGLVQECITKGDASSGFANEYLAFAPGMKFPDGSGYRIYIESIFDELSTEVKVLFDRRDPAAALWPRRATFEELLDILNAPELALVWAEDETIGWVYQYFNSGDERRKMRDESQAPRNSRELAIRNQFFTPSYVVQFLSDNTLGRIWYEMRKGDTRLAEICEYMVRQLGEVFSDAGTMVGGDDNLVPHRPLKDPRDLRVIDPACGSGHFLLYCFLLLLIIYEEAWNSDDTPSSEATGRTLREDYPDFDELLKALPGLILGCNLHGVDIDPRCAQIAQLALWMRAQRAFQDLGVARSARPIIRRSNIVIAEPMPGDPKLVDEFAASLSPPVLGNLFQEIVGEMTLAGEMGSLLPIESQMAFSIQRARKAFVEYKLQNAQGFLPGLAPERRQSELDLSGIDDGTFFEQAEDKIFSSLKAFVADAVNGVGARRRLFAEDAQQGIALIDLLRKQFDVVLMNPPFGAAAAAAATSIDRQYPRSKNDLYTAFVEMGIQLAAATGMVGVISSRAGFFLTSFRDWRVQVLLSQAGLSAVADLGYGVLDAKVETAAYCLTKTKRPSLGSLFVDIQSATEKSEVLREVVGSIRRDNAHPLASFVDTRLFESIPTAPFAYKVPESLRLAFSKHPRLNSERRTIKAGIQTSDDARFVRLWWEVPAKRLLDIPSHLFSLPASDFQQEVERLTVAQGWCQFAKGGEYSPFYGELPLVINWKNNGREAKAFAELTPGTKHWSRRMPASEYYFRGGLTFLSRTSIRMCAFPLPAGALFSNEAGPGIFVDPSEIGAALGRLNSGTVESLVSVFQSRGMEGDDQAKKYMVGTLQNLPWPAYSEAELRNPVSLGAMELVESIRSVDETSTRFRGFRPFPDDITVKIESSVRKNDDNVLDAYGFSISEIDATLLDTVAQDVVIAQKSVSEQHALYSYALGTAFGRWSQVGVKAVDWSAFQSKPPLAALSNPTRTILVDDNGMDDDVVTHILNNLPTDASVNDNTHDPEVIRAYLRKEFFDRHIKHYSRAQRKAPIYWQIGTSSTSYTAWLYCHALDGDSIYRVLQDFVAPKLDHERRALDLAKSAGAAVASAVEELEIDRRRQFVEELSQLAAELRLVAPLWQPHLDDGVAITMSPLWRVVPDKAWQKELRTKWHELQSGKYDWAHIAMHLWPERVVPKCADDRSLAIAHGLENEFWFEGEDGKSMPRRSPLLPIEALVAERTSPSVKDALKNFIEAPDPVSPSKRSYKSKAA